MIQLPYTYFPGENGHQYDDLDLTAENTVEARYSQAPSPLYKGSPLIEALPWPRTKEETLAAYQRNISYSFSETEALTTEEKLLSLKALVDLRFPLPFHYELEYSFYNALATSYHNRKSKFNANAVVSILTGEKMIESHHQLVGNTASAANTGVALLGYSGCGKSSALEILLEHYPQVIYHEDANGGRYPQIVYITLNCVPNSNFSALYARIGEAIDRALNLEDNVYERMIEAKRSLGGKSACVRKLIEVFSIGAIILDAIQLIDFNSTKENSFESLLLLTNETKVAFVVIGTEDAYEKMFKELRTARRIGEVINGNAYCENRTYFMHMVAALFRYQWFEEPVKLTNEITEALYEISRGIVCFLIKAYEEMHRAYYDESPRPIVDANFIRCTVRPRMERFYRLMQDTGMHSAMRADNDIDLYWDRERQNQFAQEYLDLCEEAERLRENVIRNIANITGTQYDLNTISQAYAKVIVRPKQEKTEKALTSAVIKMLAKAPPKREKKVLTPVSSEEMKKELLLKKQ